ncbi:hypothetical protein ACQPWW_09720 [Micromonospora sp. CA-240977]|uniref:hypothetical protein n=1 Tax=Micromonospora sp. CA-240977 TaxID=3239957 RepID=UPI003D8D35A0
MPQPTQCRKNREAVSRLDPEQCRVTRQDGSERPFGNACWDDADKSLPMREYAGLIWIEDKPGIRLRILARSLDEAETSVIEKYGDGHVVSIWSEEDASSAR